MAGIVMACVIGLIAALTFYGAAVIEGQYQKHHPPDEDGISEVKRHEQDPGE